LDENQHAEFEDNLEPLTPSMRPERLSPVDENEYLFYADELEGLVDANSEQEQFAIGDDDDTDD